MAVTGRCEACGAELAARPAANGGTGRPPRYCSNSCRQRAYRSRQADKNGTAAAAAPSEAPALPGAGAATPGNLPAPLDRFVGRGRELAELCELMQANRLLTLLGPGGAGKTRLSLELARQLRGGFPDGTWFVELAPLTSAAVLAQTVAMTIGVHEVAGHAVAESVTTALAPKHALLVIDNCEHLIDASASLIENLLRRCPRLNIIVTSREALELPGEVIARVNELSLPEETQVESRTALLESDAVRLFLERARALLPDFELTAANGPVVAGICQRLDGNPLAIELAARRLRLLSPEEILPRLENRFGLLTTGARTAVRHRDLRTAIEWSHDLLDPAEQTVFRRLSVLVGGFNLEAAAAVCAGDDVPAGAVLGLVSSLEAKSLVVPTLGVGGGGRFRQLESIKAYGQERLAASGEEDATHERFVAWLTDLVEVPESRVFIGSTELARLSDERDNLLHAFEWSAKRDDPRQLMLAVALSRCWRDRGGYATEVRSMLARALDSPEQQPRYRHRALLEAGHLALLQGDLDEATRRAGQALELSESRQPPLKSGVRARPMLLNSQLQLGRGNLTGAREFAERALELARPLGNPLDLAMIQHHLAYVALRAGDLDRAATLADESLAFHRDLAEPRVKLTALHQVATLALLQDKPQKADSTFRQILVDRPPVQEEGFAALEGLGILAANDGQPQRALRLLSAASALRRRYALLADPMWTTKTEELMTECRDRMPVAGADAAEQAGAELSVDSAREYALHDRWDDADAKEISRLSDREQEITGLVAAGLTNRAIAGKLRISERTVESHLMHIRTKLDLRSRAQVAAWAAGRQT